MKNEKNPKKEKDELIADPLKIFFIITIVPFSMWFPAFLLLASMFSFIFNLIDYISFNYYGISSMHINPENERFIYLFIHIFLMYLLGFLYGFLFLQYRSWKSIPYFITYIGIFVTMFYFIVCFDDFVETIQNRTIFR
jgi:hypothetical protein